jgi:uncharacterized protein (TIGR00369 family)
MPAPEPRRSDWKDAVQKLHDRTPLAQRLGAAIERIEPGLVIVSLELREDLTQQHGYAHAGVLAALADIACGNAAYSLMAEGEEVLSVSMSVSLMRPAKGNRLRAVGRVVKPGRRMYFTEAEVFSDSGNDSRPVTRASIVMTAG